MGRYLRLQSPTPLRPNVRVAVHLFIHSQQVGEHWALLQPIGRWLSGSSRFDSHYLLLIGIPCGRWHQPHSRPMDVSGAGRNASGYVVTFNVQL